MKVVLEPGEKVVVTFAGTDGEITVAFADGGATVRVEADLPDSSGRSGVIYEERAGPPAEDCPCGSPEGGEHLPPALSPRQERERLDQLIAEEHDFLSSEVDYEARDHDDLPEDDE